MHLLNFSCVDTFSYLYAPGPKVHAFAFEGTPQTHIYRNAHIYRIYRNAGTILHLGVLLVLWAPIKAVQATTRARRRAHRDCLRLNQQD
jgi:hypothetical protein